MGRRRSIVQMHHEEMAAMFEVIKTARRLVNLDPSATLGVLAQDISDLDELRASQQPSDGQEKKV